MNTIIDTAENLISYLKTIGSEDAEAAISELECATRRFAPESFFELHSFGNGAFGVVIPKTAIFNM